MTHRELKPFVGSDTFVARFVAYVRTQASDRQPDAGVYVLRTGDAIKIGWSSNVRQRLYDHATSGLAFTPLFLLPVPARVERYLHRHLRALRLSTRDRVRRRLRTREWFAMRGDVSRILRALARVDAVRYRVDARGRRADGAIAIDARRLWSRTLRRRVDMRKRTVRSGQKSEFSRSLKPRRERDIRSIDGVNRLGP